MAKTQFSLLGKRRFLPLFLTQFLGAFNDNAFKNALVILITYIAAEKSGIDPQILVTLAAGIFILPYFILSATAGQLADKYEKSMLIRRMKLIEILLMCSAAVAFATQSVWLLMTVLFFMGMQSTFFGPLKYSILPQHLEDNELIGGNAMVSAGTFIAILLGTIVGGLLILAEMHVPLLTPLTGGAISGGVLMVSTLTIGVALLGWWASYSIPKAPASEPQLKVSWNIPRETWRIVCFAREEEDVFLSIVGISWFWLVGATFLAQFPNFAKVTLGADETVVTFFLTMFSVGIAIGSMLCDKLLKGIVSGVYAPIGALGMAVFTVALYWLSKDYVPAPEDQLMNFMSFATDSHNWPIIGCLLAVSVCGGIYVVPLYAIMQSRSPKEHRARIIAANNVMNSLFMVVSALASTAMLAGGFTVTDVFLTIGLVNVPVAFIVRRIVIIQRAKVREKIAAAREEAEANNAESGTE
jgi:acyl-[acyl-carrier-protein]-phospholipid O-acyltransferase / long-chain-fatty-acid--[acyl-carrier-protein] ligase